MGVKSTFKQSDVGVIPDDWNVLSLGDVSAITTGDKDVNEGNPNGDFPFFTCSRNHTFSDSYSFDTDAILIAGNGDVGNLHYYSGKFEAYQRTYVVHKFSTPLRYLWWQLNYRLVDSLGLGTIGTSIPYIKKENLTGFSFPIPPTVSEQDAIADALSDADAYVESVEKLIAKSRDLKQGTMQELLTGKRRLPAFSGEWTTKAVGQIASASKGVHLASGAISEYGSAPHLNGGIAASGYTESANTPPNTIAISEGGNSCGFVQMMTLAFWCGGHCYAVRPINIDNRFLYYALKAQEQAIMGLRVGSGLPNIQKAALLGFRLRFPTDGDEQVAIAGILADMDSEIAELEASLDKARDIKHGMMQNLLTGRSRLV